MYQSRRAGDKAKKHKSPAKSGRVGITAAVIGRCWKPSQQIYKQSLALKEFSQSIFFVQKKALKCKMLFHCLL